MTTKAKTALITGACGLVGSEATLFFGRMGWRVIGIDNNAREAMFGWEGNTRPVGNWLSEQLPNLHLYDIDICSRGDMLSVFYQTRPDAVIHCAAQPSHDYAAKRPYLDFDTNAGGTLVVLESSRLACPESPVVICSTNKVYGDYPNTYPIKEMTSRWEYADEHEYQGISEACPLDGSMHSLFGCSKAAGDLYGQEYARYHGMPVAVFRGGCLTGARHAGVELHGFLSYLVKCAILGKKYTVFGYKGKQVRDNIDAYDVVTAFWEFIQRPATNAVYNIGGGYANSTSILEAITTLEAMTGEPMNVEITDQPRRGDHICYYSDMTRFRTDYPNWTISKSLPAILAEMCDAELARHPRNN